MKIKDPNWYKNIWTLLFGDYEIIFGEKIMEG